MRVRVIISGERSPERRFVSVELWINDRALVLVVFVR